MGSSENAMMQEILEVQDHGNTEDRIEVMKEEMALCSN